MQDIVGNKKAFDLGLNIVGNGAAIASRLIPSLAGSQYGTFSYTFTDTGKIKHTYATTQTGVEYDLSDGYTVTAGDIFSTPAACTDILVDDVSVGLGGAAPNDGKVHTVTFIVNSGASITHLWQDGASGAFFIGQYLNLELIDTSTASDIVINNFVFDSGSTTEQYARGSAIDKITLINFSASDWVRYTLVHNIIYDSGIIAEAWISENLIINGGFNTDTDWTPVNTTTNGWSISGGEAVCDDTSNASLRSDSVVSIGSIYLSTFSIISRISGTARLRLGGQGTAHNSAGRYSEILIPTATEIQLEASFSLGFDGSCDDVSVQHLLEVA